MADKSSCDSSFSLIRKSYFVLQCQISRIQSLFSSETIMGRRVNMSQDL